MKSIFKGIIFNFVKCLKCVKGLKSGLLEWLQNSSMVHVLTPNCLLIGRPVAANEAVSSQCRLKVIDSLLDSFVEKLTDLFAPTWPFSLSGTGKILGICK